MRLSRVPVPNLLLVVCWSGSSFALSDAVRDASWRCRAAERETALFERRRLCDSSRCMLLSPSSALGHHVVAWLLSATLALLSRVIHELKCRVLWHVAGAPERAEQAEVVPVTCGEGVCLLQRSHEPPPDSRISCCGQRPAQDP